MKITKLVLFFCISCLAVTAFGQKTSEKPYQQWSKDEAMKVISALPWANQYQSTGALAGIAMQQQQREQSDTSISGRERGSSSRLLEVPPIIIRLHSALPVREALLRLRQLQLNYEKMSDADKKKFDTANSTLLNCPICKDYYVVTLLKYKDSSMGSVDDGLFERMKLEDFQGKLWLENDKNERRELVQFTPPKGSGDTAIFYFKRVGEDGKPLLTPENKSFKFVIAPSLRERNNNPYAALLPDSFEFKISKITVDGKVEF
jgi:hypothetical protein